MEVWMLRIEWIQKNQPVNLTGALVHSLLWLTGSFTDVVQVNPRYKRPDNVDEGVAIYCIHGTADRSSSFGRIASRILQRLPCSVSGIHLISFDKRAQGAGIDDFALQLREKIRANGHKDVVIMGHSRGGLIAAYYAEYFAAEDNVNVHFVIPICTPFGGSALAMMPLSWMSSSVRQMEAHGPFLEELADKIRASGRKYYPVSAENDVLVAPDAVCIPEHRPILLVLDRHGHLSITSSHRLNQYILQRLGELCFNLYHERCHSISAPQTDPRSDNETESPLTLENVCIDLDGQIQKLQSRGHLRQTTAKVEVLMRLRDMLCQMIEGDRGQHYPQAENTGEFIVSYLQDAMINGGIRAVDILGEQLNYPFSLFSCTKTDTQIFMEQLADKYQQVDLPLRSTLVLAENH
jgi:pimeloyl-ACP methyl ester carboxylesterase